MPETPARGLALLCTFLPIFAFLATVLAAAFTRGGTRWIVLAAVPGLFLMLCWWATPWALYDGNLLGAVLFIGYYAALALYYPALLVAALIAISVSRRQPANTTVRDRDAEQSSGTGRQLA